jgi:hypothetical protein
LALYRDVEISDVEGHLEFREPKLPPGVRRAVAEERSARIKAERAAQEAAKAPVEAARALVDNGRSRRDAVEVLGISHQRVQQLV